jgi:hypothetical protein
MQLYVFQYDGVLAAQAESAAVAGMVVRYVGKVDVGGGTASVTLARSEAGKFHIDICILRSQSTGTVFEDQKEDACASSSLNQHGRIPT